MNALQQSCHQTNRISLYLVVSAITMASVALHVRAQALSDSAFPDPPTVIRLNAPANAYPNAPSAIYFSSSMPSDANDARQRSRNPPVLPTCPPKMPPSPPSVMPSGSAATPPPCLEENPLRIVVNAEERQSLTSSQKGMLAIRSVIDPFNLIVIGSEAAIGVGVNAHSAYGPGLKGFGRLAGYDLAQDAQGEFFGTFLIPSLVHEDPRYRRMQNAGIKRRIFHAIGRTVIAQHDDGREMPNYATLLTYPVTAELSNLYVPGIQTDGRSTGRRIAIGLATDPVGNIIAEFLPDIARRIHVRSVFIQQIVNQMATGQPLGTVQ